MGTPTTLPDTFATRLLAGVIFMLLGGAVLFFAGRTITVRCEKKQDIIIDCNVTGRWLNLIALNQIAAANVVNAQIQKRRPTTSFTEPSRVVLVTRNRIVPLVDFYDYPTTGEEIIPRLNSFISAPLAAPALFEIGPKWFWVVFSVFFISCGPLIIFKGFCIKNKGIDGVSNKSDCG